MYFDVEVSMTEYRLRGSGEMGEMSRLHQVIQDYNLERHMMAHFRTAPRYDYVVTAYNVDRLIQEPEMVAEFEMVIGVDIWDWIMIHFRSKGFFVPEERQIQDPNRLNWLGRFR